MAQADQIAIKSLDDLPGFASQQDKPGMQIAPLTPPTSAPQPVDLTSITPAYDPAPLLEGITTIANAQREEIKASSDAIQKNTIISQTDYAEQVKQQESVLQSYDNLQRIGRNPLAPLFALFDPTTWNPGQQKIEIEKAQLRSQQSTLRSQSLININNQVPALKKTEAELAGLGFENQLKYFGAVKDVTQLTNAQMETRLKAVDLTLKMSQEERTLVEQAAKNLTGDQAKAELKKAKAGQGQWVGRAGILEDIIQRSDKQDLDASQIRQNMASQRFDLAEKQMSSLVRGTDFASGQALIEDALATHKSTINIKGVPVPLGIVITGMEQVRKDTEALTAASLGNSLYGMNEKMQTLTTQNSALALSNPKAAQRLQDIARFAQATDKRDPYQVQRFNSFLDIAQKDTTEAIKRAASIYQSPEAKAAYEEFANNGQFTSQSGGAVVQEALGIPAVTTKSKFPDTWNALQMETARRVRQLSLTGAPKASPDSRTGAAEWMAFMARNPNKKISDIKAEIVQSGFANDVLEKETRKIYTGDAMKNVLDTLSTTGPQATTFLNLARQPSLYHDDKGNILTQKVAEYLAQQSALTGGKSDYLSAFLAGMDAYATSANSMTADPGMITEDYALLGHSYGGDNRNNALFQFKSEMTIQAELMRRAIDKGIQSDVSGLTQSRASISGAFTETNTPEQIQQFLSQVPSATGVGTAEDFKKIYGTDPRFGTSVQPTGRRP